MNIYTEEDLLVTERELAKSLNFDINVPLSYVFLRRFARVIIIIIYYQKLWTWKVKFNF